MFEKILVAIDKAEITDKILEAAIDIAKNKQVKLTLVNASHGYVSNGMTYVPENFLEEMLNEMEKEDLNR